MATKISLSRLMKLSWEIQRNKKVSRSKALAAAWAILSNEDVTIYYLVKRHSHNRPAIIRKLNQYSLFNPSIA